MIHHHQNQISDISFPQEREKKTGALKKLSKKFHAKNICEINSLKFTKLNFNEKNLPRFTKLSLRKSIYSSYSLTFTILNEVVDIPLFLTKL